MYEKTKAKNRKVTFNLTHEIELGSEVRTKSSPIYSAGSVALNFAGGMPLVGFYKFNLLKSF